LPSWTLGAWKARLGLCAAQMKKMKSDADKEDEEVCGVVKNRGRVKEK
jgi:hypothetical protein